MHCSTLQREHAGSRQSEFEGALEGSSIRQLLEALPVLEVVVPLPVIYVGAIRAGVDARAMPLAALPVPIVHGTVLPGEGSEAVVHAGYKASFVRIFVSPSAHQGKRQSNEHRGSLNVAW
jgi:hypothetical protein